jgi:hypothetical protein
LPLVAGIALHGFDDVGNEIVAALELHIDVRPGVVGLNIQPHEPVVDPDDGNRDHRQDYEDEDESHAAIIGRAAKPRPPSLTLRRGNVNGLTRFSPPR